MSKILDKAIFDISKVNALMLAYESAYLDIEVSPEDYDRANNASYAFYAIWDEIASVSNDLKQLARNEVKQDC